MRYVRFLVIPAAFVVGIYAVNSVQAQTYSKTGYNPAKAGSVVTFSYGGQNHTAAAQQVSGYAKTGHSVVAAPQYAPTVQYVQPEPQVMGYGQQQPTVQYAQPEVQYAEPIVQYAEPVVQYAEPVVRYAEPRIEYVNAPQQQPTYLEHGSQVLSYEGHASSTAGYAEQTAPTLEEQFNAAGQGQVVVVRDTSKLPGYGTKTPQPSGYAVQPHTAETFPAVYAQPGSASHILQTVSHNNGYGG